MAIWPTDKAFLGVGLMSSTYEAAGGPMEQIGAVSDLLVSVSFLNCAAVSLLVQIENLQMILLPFCSRVELTRTP